MRYNLFLLIVLLMTSTPHWGQGKYEREFRIKKSDFPANALELITDQIKNGRRIRFYKGIDSITTSYQAKFKKDKLHYSVEFNKNGELEDIEILIDEVDIPNDVYDSISEYLNRTCPKFRIRRFQQQYPVKAEEEISKVIKDAFQNLLLNYINYELIVSCKDKNGRVEFEYLFNADGSFMSMRKSLPANYDHILY